MIDFTDEPTVKDYLRSVRRHRWIAGAVLAVALLAGFQQAFLTTPQYKGSALVIADTSTSNTRDFVDKVEVPEVARVVELLSSQVLSAESLAALAVRMNIFPSIPPEQVASRMRAAVSTEVVGFDTFRVSFVHPNAATAARVANELASLFIAEHKAQREANGDATNVLLSTELASVAATLKGLDAKMKSYRIANAGSLPGQIDGNLRAIERWAGDLRLNTMSLQRAREKLALATESTPVLFQGEPIEALRAEIKGLEAERTALEKLIAKSEALNSRAGEVEGTLAGLQRDYSAGIIAYNDLLKRRQDAALKVGLDRSRYGRFFKIVEPAKTPRSPWRPIRPLVMGVALLAGLLFGAAAAVARDYFDETFHDSRELARHTGLPVLAVIPRSRFRLLRG